MLNDQIKLLDDPDICTNEIESQAEVCQISFEPFRISGLWNRHQPSVSLHFSGKHPSVTSLRLRQDRRFNDSLLENLLASETVSVND
jgi:hypothetical protein